LKFGSLHVLKDISFDSGEIYIEGRDLKRSRKELMPQIDYLPQTPAFYNYMTAYEYLNFIRHFNSDLDAKKAQANA
jgi:ABC-type multidrug transport system ATPase subunit